MLRLSLSYLFIIVSVVAFSQADFVDVSEIAGLTNSANARGVAVCDFDRDGDSDLYFSNSGQSNVLYQNNGDLTFTDITEIAGVGGGDTFSNCATWADYDNDGLIDLYVGNHNVSNILFKNNGDGTFTDVTINTGVGDSGFCRNVIWADINGDNYLDLYVSNMNMSNLMYINQGGEYFLDQVDETNSDDNLVAQASIFFDYDNDYDQDIYLVHDADQANILFQNNGEGEYQNVAPTAGVNHEANGMGVDVADYNGDGFMDLFFSNLGDNTLMSNNGDGTFTNITEPAGVFDGGMGWGVFFFDYNNDRWPDIYVCMDSNFAPIDNKLFENQGDSTFVLTSQLDESASSNSGFGSASIDFDSDGKLDIVCSTNGLSTPNLLLHNESLAGNWIGFSLEGVESNFCAIGARIEITHELGTQVDEINAGASWASQNSMRLHFGLGDIEEVEDVKILWPSGYVEIFDSFDINEYHHVVEGQSEWIDPPPPPDLGVEHAVGEELNLVGISELERQNDFVIYPNPVQERLYIESNLEEPIRLYDAQGKLIFKDLKPSRSFWLDVSRLNSGLYWVFQNGIARSFIRE